MSKWLEDLLLNIEIWLYRRLRRLLQHGGTDFAVSLDTLHAHLDEKEQYRDGVYLHLKERLEGTDEHPLAEGVPVRPLPEVQDLAHLQEAVELLGERKIEDASPDIPDGVSFERLLCDGSIYRSTTKLIDTNHGWTATNNYFRDICNIFPNVDTLQLNFVTANLPIESSYTSSVLRNAGYLKHIHFDEVEELVGVSNYTKALFSWYGPSAGSAGGVINHILEEITFAKLRVLNNHCAIYASHAAFDAPLEEITFPSLETATGTTGCAFVAYSGNSTLKRALFPVIENCGKFYWAGVNGSGMLAGSFSVLEYLYIGYKDNTGGAINLYSLNVPTLFTIELKDGFGKSLNISAMHPTLTDDNLQQFLANFRKYIIIRLANRSGIDPTTGRQYTALTLTLSAAVYQAIYGLDSSNNADNNSWARTHTLADLGLTADDLTEAETAAGITINTIYATWLDTYRSAINWNIGH